MKKLMIALLGSAAFYSAPAAHADNWSGFYGGIFAGYGWSNTDVGYLDDAGSLLGLGDPCDGYSSVSATGSFFGVQASGKDYYEGPPPPYTYCEGGEGLDASVKSVDALALPGQTDLGSFDADGEMLGVSAGINFQTGNWVIGVEAEGGLLGLNENYSRDLPDFGGEAVSADLSIDGGMYMGVFGKLGYSFGQTMLYGKVGYGAADLGISVSTVSDFWCSGICWSSETDDMTEAFMYGAGVEHIIGNGISLKLEYVRMEFEETEIAVQNFDVLDYYAFETSVDTVKLGLNFRLSTPE